MVITLCLRTENMQEKSVSFIFGDRPIRPGKAHEATQHIIRDVFTAQGFICLGIVLQAACTIFVPRPYYMLPGVVLLAFTRWENLSQRLKNETEETARIVGRTAAYLNFDDPSHAGKEPGSPATLPDGVQAKRSTLAVMLIGSQCHSQLGALQPEFRKMGEAFKDMIHELRTAPPEDDVGFLNAENYMHSGQPANNSNMTCIYFKSYAHMIKFSHMEGGLHWKAWNKFKKLQREQAKLGTDIGLWHEVFEVSNAEGIYVNMPRFGLGDMWDAVQDPTGKFVYRNSLVSATGRYTTSEGRMGHGPGKTAPTGEKEI